MKPSRPYRVTGTAEAFDAGTPIECQLIGARLKGGSDVSSAIIRETNGSGAVLAELQCVANGADETRIPVLFRRTLHVTLTGTGATCTVYV